MPSRESRGYTDVATYKMVVLSNAVAGREEECDHWYCSKHLHDVTVLPGFVSAQRFSLAHRLEEKNPYQFMAIYEIESDDLSKILSGLVSAAETGELEVSSALDSANAYAVVYSATGEPVRDLSSLYQSASSRSESL